MEHIHHSDCDLNDSWSKRLQLFAGDDLLVVF